MVYGYVRVSTDKQDAENQRFEINHFCAANGLEISEWIEETASGTKDYKNRRLGDLLNRVNEGDTIICTEISRLGRSLYMIFDVMKVLSENGVALYTIKDNFHLDNTISSKVLAFAFGLSAEIERNLISQRTKEALSRKKAEGIRLGRPPGSKNRVVKCTDKEAAIRTLRKEGHNYSHIARLLHVDRSTLVRYIKTRMEDEK